MKGLDVAIREEDGTACFVEKFRRSKMGNHWIAISGKANGSLIKKVYFTPLRDIEQKGVELFKPWEDQSVLVMLVYQPTKGLSFCDSTNPQKYKLTQLPISCSISLGLIEYNDFMFKNTYDKLADKSPEEIGMIIHQTFKELVDGQIPLNCRSALRGVSTYLANHTVRRIARD
jgi:hypothetical protein